MSRLNRLAPLAVALLLAAAVAYFNDPVLSDPSRQTESTPTPTASTTPTDASATSTPPTATSTPAVNSPPTVHVMRYGGFRRLVPVPHGETQIINASGARASVDLRGRDEDGNLDYLAVVDENDEILGRADCDASMGSECTLEVRISSPGVYDKVFKYYGIAVDTEDAISETKAGIEITWVQDSSGSAYTPSSYRPPPPALTIRPPAEFDPIIANLPAVIQPRVTYVGSYHRLSYSLVNKPGDMVIDSDNGTMIWTPQKSDEGKTVNVTVRVTDGTRTAQTTFSVTVIKPQNIQTQIVESQTDGNKLTVTDTSTTLNGLVITSPQGETSLSTSTLGQLQTALGKAPSGSVPNIPSRITPISDVFVVSSSFDNPVALSFPLSALPSGVSIDDVNLYAYVDAFDVQGKFWAPVLVDMRFEGTAQAPIYVVELSGLEGMAFFGYRNTSGQTQSRVPTPIDGSKEAPAKSELIDVELSGSNVGTRGLSATSTGITVSCVKDADWFDFFTNDDYTCTAPTIDSGIKIKVIDFFAPGTGWVSTTTGATTTATTTAEWVIHAQRGLAELDLGYDKEITVKIEEMDDGQLGYVMNRLPERRRTLHITDDLDIDAEEIKATVFHEYFHHAQGHDDTKMTFMDGNKTKTAHLFISGIPGKPNKNALWLLEGTADWFPGELDSSLGKYEESPNNIFEVGLNAYPDSNDGDYRRNEYHRHAFFKIMHDKCTNFHSHVKSLLNDRSGSLVGGYLSSDKTGIKNLAKVLEEAGCDFGDHFGQSRSGSLEAAIAYYNYATDFSYPKTFKRTYPLSADILFDSSALYWHPPPLEEDRQVTSIPAAGAFFLNAYTDTVEIRNIFERENRDPGKVVLELVVEPTGGKLIVSLASDSEGFIPKNSGDALNPENFIGPKSHAHAWFSTASTTSYIISATSTFPVASVTVINPSLDTDVDVEISLRIRKVPKKVIASFQNFYVIEEQLNEYGDHNRECKRQLGTNYRLATWTDLKNYATSSSAITDLIAGLNWINENNLVPGHTGTTFPAVSRDGKERWGNTRRHYFVSRHDHVRPSYYLAHDHINNYHLSLGSWYGHGGQALCYKTG